MNLLHSIHKTLIEEYGPDISQEVQFSDLLFSTKIIELPKRVLSQAQTIAKELNLLKRDSIYLDHIKKTFPSLQNAVLCSLDFHLDHESNLKLIEVNTNASSYLLCDLLYKSQKIPALTSCPQEEIINDFLTDLHLFQKENDFLLSPPKKIAIIDENPCEQKMHKEFLLFKELFKKYRWASEIYDFTDLSYSQENNTLTDPHGESIDFVYNRLCDFYLSSPASQQLKNAYDNRAACFSPNPQEYQLLADKNRLFDLTKTSLWEKLPEKSFPELRKSILKTHVLTEENSDDLWRNRKKLFFKPSQSYGGKQTYRGSGISLKKFKEITPHHFVAQEFVPAPVFDIQNEKFKFDLRFFIYADKINMAIARVYQGQTTNIRTPGGGFACIGFS